MKNLFRWILVLPGSALVGLFVFFALRFIFTILCLFVSFEGENISFGAGILLSASGIASHSFILGAAFIAPAYKKMVALIFLLIVLCLVIFRIISIENFAVFKIDFLQCVVVFIGAVAAFYKIRKESKITSDSFFVELNEPPASAPETRKLELMRKLYNDPIMTEAEMEEKIERAKQHKTNKSLKSIK